MKLRKVFVALTTISLLTSCSQNNLRSDIANFIASFSLEDSIKAYLEAGYIETKIATENDTVTKTVLKFDFNVKDALHPQYKKVTSTFINENFDSEVVEEIKEENEKFYFYKTGEETSEYSLEQVHSLVEKFFYQEVVYETIHLYGMYYGDYIKQIVTTLQSLVTIDEERDLYCYSASRTYLNDKNIKVFEEQNYEVNRLGMLVKNDLVRSTDSLSVVTHIETYVA